MQMKLECMPLVCRMVKVLFPAGVDQDSPVVSGQTGKWHQDWFLNRKGGL